MIEQTTRFGLLRPTTPTRIAASLMVLLTAGTAAYLLWSYAALPDLLPVRFKANGAPNGWQYKAPFRVLMPVFVQCALMATLGSIATLLLARSDHQTSTDTPDIRAAKTAAEAVTLIAAIWIAFQSYAAFAVVGLWMAGRSGLGRSYLAIEVAGLLLTGVVGARAQARLGRPSALPYVPEHWRFGQLYCNGAHPALFVPTRDGSRWTLNFGRPAAVIVLALIMTAGITVPTIILALALRA